jgi:hypothetical protein
VPVVGVCTLSVLVAEEFPGVKLAGLKLPVAPDGKPVTLSVTALVNELPLGVLPTVMTYCAEPPAAIVCVGGVALSVKSLGAATPVPVSEEVCVVGDALSVTVSVALKLVAEAGVKVAEMVQLDPAARVAPQVVELSAKAAGFVPVMEMPELLWVAVPELANVAIRGVAFVVPVV